ncbi:hypothetical protein D1007_40966 [Hordeum vulgare]|nr:hypothetical protein D1007_40966 [Hordeum vulgare]
MASISSAIDCGEDWVIPGSDSSWTPEKMNKQSAYLLAVQVRYWEMLDEQFAPLQNDEKIGYTDSEDEDENDGMLIEEEHDGEDMPQIEWNRDNPNLNADAVYKNIAELRNALTMYCIQSHNVYGTEKNEKRKLTVHCPDHRCSWKLHAIGMHGKNTIQISNAVPMAFDDNDAYQAAATAAALKVAKPVVAALSAWPLVCRVTRKKEYGSKERKFLTCESMLEVGKDVSPSNHFEWMDEYIERLQMEGLIDSTGAAKMVLDLRSARKMIGAMKILRYDSVAPTMGDAEFKGELKKLNKHLRQMIDLTKQANLIVAAFYLCILALGFAYLLIITR